jgi:hypothetical protein
MHAEGEAQACSEAINAAALWGMGHIQIEADAKKIIRTIQSRDFDLTLEGVI